MIANILYVDIGFLAVSRSGCFGALMSNASLWRYVVAGRSATAVAVRFRVPIDTCVSRAGEGSCVECAGKRVRGPNVREMSCYVLAAVAHEIRQKPRKLKNGSPFDPSTLSCRGRLFFFFHLVWSNDVWDMGHTVFLQCTRCGVHQTRVH